MTLEERLRDIRLKLDGARRAGNLRLLHALERERARCERASRREVEREVENAMAIARRDAPKLRKFAKADGFLGISQRAMRTMSKVRRDLQDLADFKAPAFGSVSPDDRLKLIVKHLRAKRAGRIAVKGGEGRGKQKQQQAQPKHAAVEALLRRGKGTREISVMVGCSQRRVQQIKAKLADAEN